MSVDEGFPAVAGAEVSDGVGFAELVAELSLEYHSDSPEQPALIDQIVAGAVAVIPGVVSAAVELRQGDTLSARVVQGDDTAVQLMNTENDVVQGICLQAWGQWEQIVTGDVTIDTRWLDLGDALRQRQVQVRAVVCTPMEVAGRKVGVLTLVSDRPHFGQSADPDIAVLARVFAAHAGVALAGRLQHADMTAALGSRDLIGQAKGILMERFKITSSAAFAMLVAASSRTNTKLVAVCERLTDTGELRTTAPKPRT